MRFNRLLATAFALALLPVSLAQAGPEKPWSKPFGGWKFTVTQEKPGVFNCRAIRITKDRMDIIAMRNDFKPYISVKAEGRKGKFDGTLLNIPGQPPGTKEWNVYGEANGERMWFIVDPGIVGEIVDAGQFQWSLPDSEDYATVKLGKAAAEAWGRVNECAVAHDK